MGSPLFVTISGSYRKFPEHVALAIEEFRDLGAIVLSPPSARIISSLEGFVSLKGDLVEHIAHLPFAKIPQALALVEDSHLEAISKSNLLWLVAPGGYLGLASAFEMGYAIAKGVPIYCNTIDFASSSEPMIHAYAHPTTPAQIPSNVQSRKPLPEAGWTIVQRALKAAQLQLHEQQRATYNATIAAGAMILHGEKALLVQTYKWTRDGQPLWSIVGGRLEKGELLEEGRLRRVLQQTGLVGTIGDDLGTFDKLADSPYRDPYARRTYSDRIVHVTSPYVVLDNRAVNFEWVYPAQVLERDDVEPNAKKAVEALLKRTAA